MKTSCETNHTQNSLYCIASWLLGQLQQSTQSDGRFGYSLNTNGHWYLWVTNHIAHTHHAGCGAPYMEARAAAVGDPGVPGAVYLGLYKHIFVCVAIANTVSASPSTPRLWWGRWRVTQAHGQAGGPLSGAATWIPRSVRPSARSAPLCASCVCVVSLITYKPHG